MTAFRALVFLIALLLIASWAGYFVLQSQKPPAGPPQPPFPTRFVGHLVTMQDGQFKSFDAATLKNVKYWAFYYSASWCPPCKTFTPKLVEFYKGFKATHPNFELIFVCHDLNKEDMLAYMKGDAMTWPAVRFDDIDRVNANQYYGNGIPDLVLVDASGKVLSDSFDGWFYTGPDEVMKSIKTMVPNP